MIMAKSLLRRWPAISVAFAHGIRMAAGLVVIKLVAVVIGPAGLGALGNLMSVVTVITVFAGGGIMTGVTKFVAQYRRDPDRQAEFVGSACAYAAIASAIVMLVTTLAAVPIARFLFGDAGLAWASPLIGVAHALIVIGALVVAIANGQYRSDVFASITIAGNLFAIPFAALLIFYGEFEGAIVGLLAVPACTAFPAALAVRFGIARLPVRRIRLSVGDASRLAKFGLMTLVSATAFPVAEIAIRTTLIASEGVGEAGLWQALLRLSGAMIGFVTVYLGSNYLPRLSACEDRSELVRLVLRQLLFAAAAFAGIALVLFLARRQVVPLLFSPEFLPLAEVLQWQLAGDTARVCAYVIGFLSIAKASFRFHLLAEVSQFSLWAALSLWTIHSGGALEQLAQAYALTYVIYLALALGALGIFSRIRPPE